MGSSKPTTTPDPFWRLWGALVILGCLVGAVASFWFGGFEARTTYLLVAIFAYLVVRDV